MYWVTLQHLSILRAVLSLIHSPEFWNDKGMKKHGTPDSVLTLPGIKLPLYYAGVYGDSDFAESHLERSDSPRIQEFPDPRSAPCENDLQATKDTHSQRSSHPPSQLAGYWEVPG